MIQWSFKTLQCSKLAEKLYPIFLVSARNLVTASFEFEKFFTFVFFEVAFLEEYQMECGHRVLV